MFSFSLGPIVSGVIVSKMKMTPTRALGLVTVINGISVVGFVLALLMGCPQGNWAGTVGIDRYNVARRDTKKM
jgi:hypothetical protein